MRNLRCPFFDAAYLMSVRSEPLRCSLSSARSDRHSRVAAILSMVAISSSLGRAKFARLFVPAPLGHDRKESQAGRAFSGRAMRND